MKHKSVLTISYTKIGDYYFPNIALPSEAGDIGIWGVRRKEFLRTHRPILFSELLLTGELPRDLAQVNQEVAERLEIIIESMKAAQGITEKPKARGPMARAGSMNNIRACAEAIVYADDRSALYRYDQIINSFVSMCCGSLLRTTTRAVAHMRQLLRDGDQVCKLCPSS